MKVEMRSIGSIRTDEYQAPVNDVAVDAEAAYFKAFGSRQPIVVNEDGVIVVGHTRYQAAMQL